MQQLEKFAALGLSDRTLAALAEKGFEEPTEIQAQCIPLLLKEAADVVGQAQTGTGKTAAFGLPILEIVEHDVHHVQALILSPTRELAMQVATEIDSLQGDRGLSILPVYGGSSMELQLRRLRSGVHVVVGTPGRVIDHLNRKTLDLSHLKFLVLDEADEMLDMGFIEDVEEILSNAPAEKRMLLFSATMPAPILSLAEKFMKDYRVVKTEDKNRTPALTDQLFYEIREGDKTEALCRIIDLAPDFYGLVFCRTKMQSDEVGRDLIDRGYNAEVIHGDLAQKQRELILHKLREKRITIVVATDVAARGIDVQDLSHVVNYNIPQNPDTYIHRIGRTGRAGKMGTAITFVTPSEMRRFTYIRRMVKSDIRQERIPDARTVVEAKRLRLIAQISSMMDQEQEHEQFETVARDLLEGRNAVKVISTILAHRYGKILDASLYKPIDVMEPERGRLKRDRRSAREYQDERFDQPVERTRAPRREQADNSDWGPVRLFIAKGRSAGMTKRMLVDYIIEHAHVRDREINEVEVHEDFSFVTAPAPAARMILEAFTDVSPEGKPLVTKARPDNPNGKHLTSYRQSRREGERPYANEDRERRYEERPRENPYRDRDERYERRDRGGYMREPYVPSYPRSNPKGKFKNPGFAKKKKGR